MGNSNFGFRFFRGLHLEKDLDEAMYPKIILC